MHVQRDLASLTFLTLEIKRYITDCIKPAEALEMLRQLEPTKAEREAKVREVGLVRLG